MCGAILRAGCTKLQLHALVTINSKKRNWDLLENCHKYALNLSWDLKDSKSTWGKILCTFGSHTFVPISLICICKCICVCKCFGVCVFGWICTWMRTYVYDLPQWFHVFATSLTYIYIYSYHESSRKPQHSKWNCVGTNRPQHRHMYGHMVCDWTLNTPKIRIDQKI